MFVFDTVMITVSLSSSAVDLLLLQFSHHKVRESTWNFQDLFGRGTKIAGSTERMTHTDRPESSSPSSSWPPSIPAVTGTLTLTILLAWIVWKAANSLLRNKTRQQQEQEQVLQQQLQVDPQRDSTHTRSSPRTSITPTNSHVNARAYSKGIVAIGSDPVSKDDDSMDTLIRTITTKPPHVSSTLALSSLVDDRGGILPFRFSKAAQYEAEASRVSTREGNKRNRARVLAKLFTSSRSIYTPTVKTSSLSSSTSAPSCASSLSVLPFDIPGPKGCNVIIVIQEQDIQCAQLPYILFLLGTYYNLFLIIDLDQDQQSTRRINIKHHEGYKTHQHRVQSLIQILRGGMYDDCINDGYKNQSQFLPEDVLPSHRIVTMNTVAGKVAFIRNFPTKIQFILEYDTRVIDTLVKFGFTILMYNTKNNTSSSFSLPTNMQVGGENRESGTYTNVSNLARELL